MNSTVPYSQLDISSLQKGAYPKRQNKYTVVQYSKDKSDYYK